MSLLVVSIAGACGDDDDSADPFCEALRDLQSFDATGGPDEIDEGIARYRQLEATAPEELREDIALLAEVAEAIVRGEPVEVEGDVDRAGANLSDEAEARCGIELVTPPTEPS